jgi:hypothetical protein
MVARRPAAIATIAVAALAAGAARATADALVYRCGPNVCKAAPDGTGKQRLTTDGKPGGPLYSWLSASADGSRLAVVNATYAYVLDGRGRRLTGKLPRGGTGVTAATGGMVTVRLRRPPGASAGELRARVRRR